MDSNSLGRRIKHLLDANHMTQRDLAKITGITEVSLSRYINGDRTPRAVAISNIANALHVSADELLGTESEESFETEYYRIHRLIARNAPKMTSSQKTELINALFESSSH